MIRVQRKRRVPSRLRTTPFKELSGRHAPMNRHLTFLLAAALWLGGATAGPLSAADADPKLVQQAFDILKKCCSRCHGPEGSNEGGMNYILDTKTLIAKKKIVPGDPAKSKLYKKIVEGEM